MSLFLGQTERFGEALRSFDPFAGDVLMKFVDPLPRRDGAFAGNLPVPYRRVFAAILLGVLPIVICCLIPHPVFGGKLRGEGGLITDFGGTITAIAATAMMGLLLIGRRMLGDLINELVDLGVTKRVVLSGFGKQVVRRGALLRFGDLVTRPTPLQQTVWLCVLVAGNVVGYYFNFVSVGRPGWGSSPAVEGSPLFILKVGADQPNLAGLWSCAIWCPFLGWMVLLAARLFICFAGICQAAADDPELRVVPTHPDGSGGLLVVGQTSFFLSLLTVTIGVFLAAFTMGEIVYLRSVHLAFSRNLGNLLILWALYLVLGTVLFLLPMTPLRWRMIGAKRVYLRNAEIQYAKLDKMYGDHCSAGFVLLGILYLTDGGCGDEILTNRQGVCCFLKHNQAIAILVIAVVGLVAGEFLDAIRDLFDRSVDWILRRWKWLVNFLGLRPVNWNFLLQFELSKVQRVDDYYFTYYVFQANFVWALLIWALLDRFCFRPHSSCTAFSWILGIVGVVFFLDAFCLRKNIANISNGRPE